MLGANIETGAELAEEEAEEEWIVRGVHRETGEALFYCEEPGRKFYGSIEDAKRFPDQKTAQRKAANMHTYGGNDYVWSVLVSSGNGLAERWNLHRLKL